MYNGIVKTVNRILREKHFDKFVYKKQILFSHLSGEMTL